MRADEGGIRSNPACSPPREPATPFSGTAGGATIERSRDSSPPTTSLTRGHATEENAMTQLTRRGVLAGAAAATALTPFAANPVRAAAPFAGKQAPGWYRYKVGNIE